MLISFLYTRIIAFAKLFRIPVHAASAFPFCPHASATPFPLTVLTKRLLLTNISKITSSSARLIDVTVTSLLFSWYAVFVVLLKNATVNNAGLKFTRYKTWGCLD